MQRAEVQRNVEAAKGFIQTVTVGVLGALGFVLWDTLAATVGFPSLDFPALLGRIFAGEAGNLSSLGFVMHLGIGAALALFYVYGEVEKFLPGSGGVRGAIYGAVIWAVAMVALMPLIPYADRALGQGQTPSPGFLMLTVGLGAPVSALIAHLIYGVIVGVASGRAGIPFFWRSVGAGVLGALLFALWDAFVPLVGLSPLEFPRLAGEQFVTDPERIAVGGLLVHLLIGLFLSVLYLRTALWRRLPGSPWARGLIYGAVIWGVSMLIVMPLIGKGFFMLDAGVSAPVSALVVHLLYGLVVGFAVTPAAEGR
jgi:uncharacterized membrane protein YagU involved in acid resistance